MIAIKSLHTYPVKSMRAFSFADVVVGGDGLPGDREFVVTDLQGKFLTQRQIPLMATVEAVLENGKLRLSTAKSGGISLEMPTDGPEEAVTVWRDEVQGLSMGPAADEFVTSILGRPARLFRYQPLKPRVRQSPRGVDYELHFPDQAQIMMTNLQSLSALNAVLPVALPMDRFRANFVIEGADAWAEEGWKEIHIGDAQFEVMKPCSRCKIVTIDQATGTVGSPEVLTVLKSEIKGEQKAADFGMHLRILRGGRVAVGDEVQVISSRRSR